ncbi:MAG: isochorismatase family protein [Anaerolineales bacterium]|nr:isochorismatase family protein [Anaerolineales bacterium]
MSIWDDLIPESDKEWFARSHHGGLSGAGTCPALLVVDVTDDFVDPRYPLVAGSMGRQVVAAIRPLLEQARQIQIPVVYTVAQVPVLPVVRGRRKGTAPSAEGNRIVADLEPLEAEPVIAKPKPSAFFATPLASWLIFWGVDTVIVTGLVTSGCIRATVVDAYSHNFRVLLPVECVGDRSEVSHKVNLFDMHMKYADVLSVADVMQSLASVAR